MATTVNPASVVVVNESNSFPTGAIVIIALGGYMLVFAILLLIRKCIVDKGGSFCPVWCSEACACQTCCNDQPNDDTGCYASLARACDCNMPNKRQCMDTVCPTKQRCNDMFCSCFSQPSNEDCCKSCSSMGDCNWCGDCGDCCNCNDCKDCCGDCECSCCSQPDSINCCCLEVKLSNSANRNPPNTGYPHQPGSYYGQHPSQPGSYYGHPSQPGSYYGQHPGFVNYGGPANMQPPGFAAQPHGFPFTPNQSVGGGRAFNQSHNFQSNVQVQQPLANNRQLPQQSASSMFQSTPANT